MAKGNKSPEQDCPPIGEAIVGEIQGLVDPVVKAQNKADRAAQKADAARNAAGQAGADAIAGFNELSSQINNGMERAAALLADAVGNDSSEDEGQTGSTNPDESVVASTDTEPQPVIINNSNSQVNNNPEDTDANPRGNRFWRRAAAVGAVVVALGAVYVGAKALGFGGDKDEVTYKGKPVPGLTDEQLSGEITSAFGVTEAEQVSCYDYPGLKFNKEAFSVNGKDVEVIAPDTSDALREDAKYTDSIANPLNGESDEAKKRDLYQSFCDNPYMSAVTANFLADLELPNGERVGDSVDWLKDYRNIEDVNDIAEGRYPFDEIKNNDPKALLKGMQENEALASKLISVFEQLKYKGVQVRQTLMNVHAPFPNANGEFPEDMVNPKQMRAKGIEFVFVFKDNNGKGKEALCLMFNKGDKRPEIVDCRKPKNTKNTPVQDTPKRDTPNQENPNPECKPPNPECTDKPRGGKDHTQSPVSDDRNAKDERTRPNRPAPDRAIQPEGAPENDPHVPPSTVPDPRPEGQQNADDSNATGSENGNENGTNGEVTGP